MRLGFYYHVPAIEKGGEIFMPGSLGCFIDSLATQCEQVICFLHSPNPREETLLDYRIACPNVEWVNLGPRGSAVERTLRPGKFTSVLRHRGSDLDLVLLRGPSPLLPAMAAAAPVPTALLLVGDYIAGVDDLPQPRWRKEAIRLWSYWNKWGQQRAARRSLTFVNSRVLYAELEGKIRDLREIRTTTLTKDDFLERADTCQAGLPYRLLYVGRLSRSKGLLQMAEALVLLHERGEQVELDLVGWPEPGESVLEDLDELAIRKGLRGKIHNLGARPLGPELFECYKNADLFVIASPSSEGFPRTIWEAMAHSLPVVATRVGSIPAFIEGAAELVQPRSASALADAISRLIHNPELRQTYIVRGRALARANTLEVQAVAIVTQMRKWTERLQG